MKKVLIISVILNLIALYGIYFFRERLFSYKEILYQTKSYGYGQGQAAGYEAGLDEGYHNAKEDIQNLINCHKDPNPSMENCLHLFLLEDNGYLPQI